MGVRQETFDRLDAVENENAVLKKALETAVKISSSNCERCPYDSRLGCRRPEGFLNKTCETAVMAYYRGEAVIKNDGS